ncbi:unnamed protein product, partial [marine sediment metagenome]
NLDIFIFASVSYISIYTYIGIVNVLMHFVYTRFVYKAAINMYIYILILLIK